MQYFCYILYSIFRDRYYIGSTSNLDERIKKHNTNHKGFTGKTGDWILKYSEVFSTVEEAEKENWKLRNGKIGNLLRSSLVQGIPTDKSEGSAVRTRVLPQKRVPFLLEPFFICMV